MASQTFKIKKSEISLFNQKDFFPVGKNVFVNTSDVVVADYQQKEHSFRTGSVFRIEKSKNVLSVKVVSPRSATNLTFRIE